MQTISVSEAKDRLSQLVESIDTTHDAVTITRHGRPAVVMLSVDDLEALQETLVLLHDPEHAAEVEEADEDIAEGRTLSLAEVREQLARR
ncbi:MULTISPECIES: type II toxin-antitoxin system Phd/YefM family antitoxin [Microbacterium]|uniref:type II toxin-antitoxin system Phd/YefM family antitoxin n=1 Tax=Microbacterium TaxID=33882 RepID=UPI000C807DFD|nr:MULTISPECIES: type II toxin-antitoxin system Phd/YefM family antitoxin [unclassified Microbacterium]MCT1395479.1 type II toxin-antitoxin system Phd/YefM family antitoxin [Microbacterium sp. p3-SID338]PMC02882.1 type II toxin-antitoxin system prevent-host-death family antitoxin [Microbacterium sp. UMB0228]